MIHSRLELVEKTLQHFARTTALSRAHNRACYYGHLHNGVGCFVGCHVPENVAARWDSESFITCVIRAMRNVENAEYRVETHFDLDAIGEEWLHRFQKMHDKAENYAHAIDSLRALQAALQEDANATPLLLSE